MIQIRDEVMGMCELSNDLLYQKIPQEDRRYYIEESLSIGREAAHKLLREPDFQGIEAWYQAAGIEIEYLNDSGKTCGVSFRAQSEFSADGEAKVFIYRGSIEELAKHSDCALGAPFSEIQGIDVEKALEIHLAHEYFHYLEYHSSAVNDENTMKYHDRGLVSEYLKQVESMHLFHWKRTSGILRCSEIAAHAFAKTLVGLEILPNHYDYCYLITSGKTRKEDYKSMLEGYECLFL